MLAPTQSSTVLGWVSIACWVIVYSPQIIENYQLKSGEGLSVAFVVIWLLGDLCNLFGALMAGLLATVIILAAYYTVCDIILLVQIYYYRATHPVHIVRGTIPNVVLSNDAGETAPLLSPSMPVPGLTKPDEVSTSRRVLMYTLAIAFVTGTGIAAYHFAPYEDDDGKKDEVVFELRSQILGWTSALLYLGSRVPQIIKNSQTKCEGLSLALFVFAIGGNATYVASILADSMEPRHLLANLSWLVGSGATILLDLVVLGQFFYYRRAERVFITDGQLERAERDHERHPQA
ncbi:PQ-loop-domain-containing protein [Auriculariales sp. MPI-PUGE-AT-0066]|nr:PQ-loop-domain-containing protein [Auriculariales sp. MPI-PUGE-AT-0066]